MLPEFTRRHALRLLGAVNALGFGSLTSSLGAAASANGWTQVAKLLAEDGGTENAFGKSVALGGRTALIGAYGQTYVFTGSAEDWSRRATLTPPPDDDSSSFGESVALDGTTAVVGAPSDGEGDDQTEQRRLANLGYTGVTVGSAYAFTHSDGDWTREAKLVALDADEEDTFGSSVALDGDTAVVAAERDEDPHGKESGSAYVFARSDGDWTQETKLTAADGDETDSFGSSVAVDGDTIFVGAALDENPNGEYAGATYVFTDAGGDVDSADETHRQRWGLL